MRELRVVYLDNLPVTRFFDKEYIPGSWNLGLLTKNADFNQLS